LKKSFKIFEIYLIILTTILLQGPAWLVQFCRVTSSFQRNNDTRKLQQV